MGKESEWPGEKKSAKGAEKARVGKAENKGENMEKEKGRMGRKGRVGKIEDGAKCVEKRLVAGNDEVREELGGFGKARVFRILSTCQKKEEIVDVHGAARRLSNQL
jgi:hypothetical protein